MTLRLYHDYLFLSTDKSTTYSEHRFSVANVFYYSLNVTPSTPDITFSSNHSLHLSDFPLRIRNVCVNRINHSQRIDYHKNCSVCGTHEATECVTNDILVSSSPFFFCDRCLSLFHYDEYGVLLTRPFNLQPIYCCLCNKYRKRLYILILCFLIRNMILIISH